MEKKNKFLDKLVGLIVGLLLIMALSHFAKAPDEKIIGVIPGYDSSEFQHIRPGIEEEAKKLGYNMITKIPREMTVQAQREAMCELVKEGADCILIEAVAEGGFQDVLDECSGKGIPVLSYNSRINSQNIYAEVLPYSVESAADAILSIMESDTTVSGQFGILSTTSQDYLREARTREMITRLEKGSYPMLRFTGSGFVKDKEELVVEKAAQLEKKYPDLEYLICYSTLDAKGITRYMEKNYSAWQIICEGALEELKSFSQEGMIVLTYDYERYGRFLAKLADDAVQSDHIPEIGDIFEWENGSAYVFTSKWGYDGIGINSNIRISNTCSITMQEFPDIVKCSKGEWKQEIKEQN